MGKIRCDRCTYTTHCTHTHPYNVSTVLRCRHSSIWSSRWTGRVSLSSTKTTTVSCKSPIYSSHRPLLIRSASDNSARDRITGESWDGIAFAGLPRECTGFRCTFYYTRTSDSRATPVGLNAARRVSRAKRSRTHAWWRLCFRKELREIKDSKETKILLDCSIDVLANVLSQAQQVDLMGSEHNFIIASLVGYIAGRVLSTTAAIGLFSWYNMCLGHAHLRPGTVQVQRHEHHRDALVEAAGPWFQDGGVAVDGQLESAGTGRRIRQARNRSGLVAVFDYTHNTRLDSDFHIFGINRYVFLSLFGWELLRYIIDIYTYIVLIHLRLRLSQNALRIRTGQGCHVLNI